MHIHCFVEGIVPREVERHQADVKPAREVSRDSVPPPVHRAPVAVSSHGVRAQRRQLVLSSLEPV